MKPLEDFIEVHEGRFPSDLADSLLREYANSPSWTTAQTAGDLNNFRVCSRIPISTAMVIQGSAKRKVLDERVFKVLNSVMERWAKDPNRPTLNSDTGYDLLRYTPGGKYDFHVDEMAGIKRVASVITCLSDANDYQGGELEFEDGPKYHLGKGDVVVFPSNFCFKHRVNPVTEGVRYSLVTWFF